MFQFIESICCEKGRPNLLGLHQERLKRTFSKFFPKDSPFDLINIITNIPSQGKYKCRLTYNANSYKINFQPYRAKEIRSMQIIHNDKIQYEYKASDRKKLDSLFQSRKEADDIIIIKSGLVTDSYYANLIFFDDKKWWTPQDP